MKGWQRGEGQVLSVIYDAGLILSAKITRAEEEGSSRWCEVS